MYVKVAYRGCAMAAMRVSHRDGCRLFYGSPPPRNAMDLETQERLFGSRKLMQLSLPPPRTAQSLIPAMWILLESTQRGLILQVSTSPSDLPYRIRIGCSLALAEGCLRVKSFGNEDAGLVQGEYSQQPFFCVFF